MASGRKVRSNEFDFERYRKIEWERMSEYNSCESIH